MAIWRINNSLISAKMDLFDKLPTECMTFIFANDDISSLYQYIQVNKHFCHNIIPLLWKNPFCEIKYNGKEEVLINSLVACMDNESKKKLKKAKINIFSSLTTNIKPLFNYSFFIRVFDYDKSYIKISSSLESISSNKRGKIRLLYRKLFQLIYNNSPSLKFLLKLEGRMGDHLHKSFILPKPSKMCNSTKGILT